MTKKSNILTLNSATLSSPLGLILVIGVVVSFVIGVYGSIALTEAGQLINMPRSWVFTFFEFRSAINIVIVTLLVIGIIINLKIKLFKLIPSALYICSILACLFFINLFAPEIWLRSQHHSAEFINISEANLRLEDNTDVFVLEIDGDARAYPRDWMQLPHIAGDMVGGQDTVMTYCALSNLPMAFNPKLNGQDTNFRVIAQTSNNLIFTDRNSGELIQQITATAEYSQSMLDEYPVQRMPYGSFKQLYPKGKVFQFKPNLLDELTLKLFDAAIPAHYEGNVMFPTLSMTDNRLANGEAIWGLKEGNKQAAIAKSAFDKSPVIKLKFDDREIIAVWFEEFETVGAFYSESTTNVSSSNDIDPYGNTRGVQLKRANLYSYVPWMIWSHWFPETTVYN